MTPRLSALLLAALLAVSVGCTPVRNPATGEVQYTSLSPKEEAELGRKEAPKAEAEFGGRYQDAELQAYVERVGERMKAASELKGEEFSFTVLDSDIVNAFALPGGHIFVSRGLLALANDEAELAGVLGHEIGHVTARHTAQRYDRAQLGQAGAVATQLAGLLLGGYLGGGQGAELGARAGGQLGGLGAAAYVQGFSREQEFQADQLGLRYLANAGYDPEAMATFLGALQAEDEFEAKLTGRKAADVGVTSDWFASHPRTLDRVAAAAAEESGDQPGASETDRAAYLAAIDDMIFGQDPAQGVVRGNRFEHPELRIAFAAPSGFKLVNRPEAVVGTDGRGRFMQFDLAQGAGNGDLGRYLQEAWVRNQRLRDVQALNVNGQEAAVGFGQVALGNRPAQAMFAAVRASDGKVYRLIYGTTGELTRTDVASFEESLRSFKPLSAAEADALQPLRIDIVTVRPGQTADDFARQMAVEQDPAGYFTLLNGLDRGRTLTPGDQVKLLRRG